MTFHLGLPIGVKRGQKLVIVSVSHLFPLNTTSVSNDYSTADFLPQSKRLPRIPLTIK
jgi:hypothetical protein